MWVSKKKHTHTVIWTDYHTSPDSSLAELEADVAEADVAENWTKIATYNAMRLRRLDRAIWPKSQWKRIHKNSTAGFFFT